MLVLCVYGQGIVLRLRNKLLHWQISRQKTKITINNYIIIFKVTSKRLFQTDVATSYEISSD